MSRQQQTSPVRFNPAGLLLSHGSIFAKGISCAHSKLRINNSESTPTQITADQGDTTTILIYGFDYLSGIRMMLEIDREFRTGGDALLGTGRLAPFHQPGMERAVHNRIWAIHDGILDEPWDELTGNESLVAALERCEDLPEVGRPADVRTFTPEP